jgi:hypothetical protein
MLVNSTAHIAKRTTTRPSSSAAVISSPVLPIDLPSTLPLTTMLLVLLIITHLLAFARAAAANVCDWVGASPVLYHQYGEESCPPVHRHQGNGVDCEWRIVPGDNYKCDSFCQVRTTFFYTMETYIFTNPYCFGPVTCSVGPKDHTVYHGGDTIGTGIDPETLKDGVYILYLILGSSKTNSCLQISGGWHGLRKGNTASPPLSITLKSNECGYFAFIPIVRDVCGTQTWGRTHNYYRKDCADDFHTVTNACNSELLRADIDQSASAWGIGQDLKGDTIFVWTNCEDHTPLPMDKQNPAYRHPGVAMPIGTRQAYTSFWKQQGDVYFLATDTAKTKCSAGADGPRVDDCADALQNMIASPGTTINSVGAEGSEHGYSTLSVS